MDYQTVMDFWFRELQPKQWWVRDAALDAQIRQRFTALHAAAAAGELFHWRRAAAGRGYRAGSVFTQYVPRYGAGVRH